MNCHDNECAFTRVNWSPAKLTDLIPRVVAA
jgi:hypothetical protein